MADIKKMFGTDPEKEVNGVWQNLGEEVRVLVARLGNKKYNDYVAKLMKPYRRQMRRGTLKDEIVESSINKALSKYILLGWEGLEQHGTPLAYSSEEALRVLEEFPEFREQVMEMANELESFQAEEDEESEKN